MAADCGVFFGEAEGGSGGVEGEEVEAGLVEGADEEIHCFFFFFFFLLLSFLLGKGWEEEEVVVVVWRGFQVVLFLFLSVKMGWFVVWRVLSWSSFLCFMYTSKIRVRRKKNRVSSLLFDPKVEQVRGNARTRSET